MFNVTSMARPKRVAKSLRKTLAEHGFPLPLAACQEAVARMYGHDGWHALLKAKKGECSPGDGEVPAETATARRVHQEAVLASLGVPVRIAGAILDDVRPTGRGEFPPHADRSPRLLVRAVFTEADGTELDLGIQDLTEAMGEALEYGLESVEAEIEQGLRLYRISGSLTKEARQRAGEPGFSLKGFKEAWSRFKSDIGDVSDRRVVRDFLNHLMHVRSARWQLEAAEKTLRVIETARFVPDASGMDMFAPLNGFDQHDRFHASPDEAYEGMLYERYVEEVEARTNADFNSPEWQEWHARYRAWEEERTPPVVFGTRPVHWEGVSARQVRESLILPGEEGHSGDGKVPELDYGVEQMIESDLADNHHEDAFDQVVGWGDLAFIAEWLPHAGSADEVDLGLEARIETWNARQTIVSYYADEKTIVPVRPDVTKEKAISWWRDHLDACRRNLEASMRWTKPVHPKEERLSGAATRSRPLGSP